MSLTYLEVRNAVILPQERLEASTSPSLTFNENAPRIEELAQGEPTTGSIKALITSKAEEYGVNPILALEIARAESGFNPRARNASSTARGLFQIIRGTEKAFNCEGDMLEAEDNVECAMRILTESGVHHWDASRKIWEQRI